MSIKTSLKALNKLASACRDNVPIAVTNAGIASFHGLPVGPLPADRAPLLSAKPALVTDGKGGSLTQLPGAFVCGSVFAFYKIFGIDSNSAVGVGTF